MTDDPVDEPGTASARTGDPDIDRPLTAAGERRELLDLTRRNAVQMLSEMTDSPQNLRVQAGDVSIEVNWDEKPVAAPVGQAGAVTTPAASLDKPAGDAEPAGRYLTAPAVGVFYPAPEPGAPPFVKVGDFVVAGQQVAIIEAMKLMIPLEAEQAGQIAEILKENGDPVEYGEQVFALADVETK